MRWWLGVAFASALGTGCSGLIGDTAPQDTTATTERCNGALPALGVAPLPRLTNFEYDNTVRDLLGVDLGLGASFTPEPRAPGFDFDNNAAVLSTPSLLVEQYRDAAAAWGEAAAAHLQELMPCDPTPANQATCGTAFVDRLLRRAFRRPVRDDERSRYQSFFSENLAAYDFATAAQMFIEVVLQSPQFLYREETGDTARAQGTAVPLTSHELASRLSYLLWRSMPDDALFAAADAGSLADPAELERQARRLLDDPRAKAAIDHFHNQWLHLDRLASVQKDATLHPEFTAELRASMLEETQRFVSSVWDSGGSLTELLTAPYTFVDDRLREHYGMPARAPGSAVWQRVGLAANGRAGVLTQAAILSLTAHAAETFPTNRGRLVREQLLCMTMPPPPEGVSTDLGALPATLPVREKLSRHATDESCGSCHRLMDPIGFGFEGFGPTGASRTADRWGNPVATNGEIIGTDDIDGPFANPTELAQKLAGSEQTRSCVATQMFQFGYGRRPERSDACTVQGLTAELASNGGSMRELLLALTTTPAFRYRVQPN